MMIYHDSADNTLFIYYLEEGVLYYEWEDYEGEWEKYRSRYQNFVEVFNIYAHCDPGITLLHYDKE